MTLIAVVNGPNLNLLGAREPQIYGETAWEEVKSGLRGLAGTKGVELEFFQSNHEGAIIDYLQKLRNRAHGLIINPGALTHYSYSLRDALAALEAVKIEVHITNIYAREEWRSRSVVSEAVDGVVCGLGVRSYAVALAAVVEMLEDVTEPGRRRR